MVVELFAAEIYGEKFMMERGRVEGRFGETYAGCVRANPDEGMKSSWCMKLLDETPRAGCLHYLAFTLVNGG